MLPGAESSSTSSLQCLQVEWAPEARQKPQAVKCRYWQVAVMPVCKNGKAGVVGEGTEWSVHSICSVNSATQRPEQIAGKAVSLVKSHS